MIYIATPYSDPRPEVRIFRFSQACFLASEIAKAQIPCFSPIAHWHFPATRYGMSTDHETWRVQNETMLELCSGALFVMMEGWQKSKGMQHELAFMLRRSGTAGLVRPIWQIYPAEIQAWIDSRVIEREGMTAQDHFRVEDSSGVRRHTDATKL